MYQILMECVWKRAERREIFHSFNYNLSVLTVFYLHQEAKLVNVGIKRIIIKEPVKWVTFSHKKKPSLNEDLNKKSNEKLIYF